MTAADHLAAAEQYLTGAELVSGDDLPSTRQTALQFAQVHLLAAIAIELGVPPVTSTPGGQQ